jgi:hypothetical protein
VLPAVASYPAAAYAYASPTTTLDARTLQIQRAAQRENDAQAAVLLRAAAHGHREEVLRSLEAAEAAIDEEEAGPSTQFGVQAEAAAAAQVPLPAEMRGDGVLEPAVPPMPLRLLRLVLPSALQSRGAALQHLPWATICLAFVAVAAATVVITLAAGWLRGWPPSLSFSGLRKGSLRIAVDEEDAMRTKPPAGWSRSREDVHRPSGAAGQYREDEGLGLLGHNWGDWGNNHSKTYGPEKWCKTHGPGEVPPIFNVT